MPMHRRSLGRRVILVAGLTVIIAAGALVARADPPVSPPGFEVLARVNGNTFPVSVGSVVVAGQRDGALCVFDEEFGVQISVTEGDIAPPVTWRVDDECRVVIVSIEDEQ